MKRLQFSRLIFLSVTFLVCLSTNLEAQPAKIPFRREACMVHTGLHDGRIVPPAGTQLAFSEVIQVPGAPWLRLHFQAHNFIGRGEYQ